MIGSDQKHLCSQSWPVLDSLLRHTVSRAEFAMLRARLSKHQ